MREFLVALFVMALFWAVFLQPAKSELSFQQWEYSWSKFESVNAAEFGSYLGAMGKQGWEMTGIRNQDMSGNIFTVYFKRPKK